MKKKFKIVVLSLVVVMLATFGLVACSAKDYKVDVANNIENGSVQISTDENDTVTVTATPADGYVVAPAGITYSSEKFGRNFVVGNTFKKQAADTVVNVRFIKDPLTVSPNGDYVEYKEPDVATYQVSKDKEVTRTYHHVYFGMYPQTIKADNVTVDESNKDANGYFLGSDGARYAKAKSNAFYDRNHADVVFTNGKQVNNYDNAKKKTGLKEEYNYFRVEPISWTILESQVNGETTEVQLLCDMVLDSKAFLAESKVKKGAMGVGADMNADLAEQKIYSNNYEHSDIRAFLNDEFFNKAFTAEQKAMIVEQTNNNKDTVAEPNAYSKDQNDTKDMVYMLAEQDLFNDGEYNFLGMDYYQTKKVDPLKVALTTDYARANGAWTNMNPAETQYAGMGYWWTRSSGNNGYATVLNSKANVNLGGVPVYKEMIGVRPVVTINIQDLQK